MPRSFADLAAGYAGHDFLVREIDGRMQERLDIVRLSPQRIVDVGCSCGGSLAVLRQRYPEAQCIGIDREAGMLDRVQDAYALQADAAKLPLDSASVGLVWSNLLLHWLTDVAAFFAETHRILQEGGLFMFSTLGPDTLKELCAAFPDGYAHTQRFVDMHDLGDLLLASGFADPVMDREDLTLHYDHFTRLLEELRYGSAACNVAQRRRGLAGAAFWRQVEAAYPQRNGQWPVTFEVIYGHAWKLPTAQKETEERLLRFYR